MTRHLLIKGRPGTGVGDHIITLVAGLLYASRHGLTTCVDWRDGSLAPKGRNAFPGLFVIEGLPTSESVPKTAGVHPIVWRDRLDALTGALYEENGEKGWDRCAFARRYSTEILEPPPAEVNVHVLSDHLVELAREITGAKDVRPFLQEFLRRHVRMAPRVEEDAQKVFSRWEGGATGMHVRMTDKSPARAEDYARCFLRLDAATRRRPLFLATDSRRAEDEIRRLLPEANLVSRGKWMPESQTPIHLSSENPDLLQTTHDALVELRLLSMCSPLVMHPASSFGLCAGFFCQGQIVEVSTQSHRPLAERIAGRLLQLVRRLSSGKTQLLCG